MSHRHLGTLAGSPHGLEVCLPPAACCLLPDTYLPTRLPPAACRLPPAACRLYPDSVSHPTPITCFLSPQVGTIGSNPSNAKGLFDNFYSLLSAEALLASKKGVVHELARLGRVQTM